MARVEWSPRAREDLREIREFIARDSERYSQSFVQKVFDVVSRCGGFPEAGSIVPEFDDPVLRERLVFRYRLIYRLASDSLVEIVAIIHGAREMPTGIRGDQPPTDLTG